MKRAMVGTLLASLLALAGCRETTINEVLAEPGRYADREVSLAGDVVRSFSLLGKGAYLLDDGTGALWVIARHGVPRRGARVAVRGRIRDVVNLGDVVSLPPEVASGLVLLESEQRAR